MRVLIAVTSSLACNFYKGVLSYLRNNGFEPVILADGGELLYRVSEAEGVQAIAVPMRREISLWADALSLWRLCREIRRLKPTVVDASTPKAGLLVSIAASICRVPCQIYTLRGLRLETTFGMKRSTLWIAEWLACTLADKVICVSPSLRDKAIELGLVDPANATVLGKGSGIVNLQRFSADNRHSPEAQQLRDSLKIPYHAPVLGFVGRFVRDKGIRELMDAFHTLRLAMPELRLLLVGDFEEGDPVEPDVRRLIESDPFIVRPGFVADTAPYYALMDVLALPTYREGFPGVPLEAQASSVPVVTTTATGAVDSVVEGVTGFIVPVGNSEQLADRIHSLLTNRELNARMGTAGRAWVEQEFQPETIWAKKVSVYRRLISEKSTPFSRRFVKRVFDVVSAFCILVLLTPLLAAITLLVRFCLGSPILFHQQRAGLRGITFDCLKFRTMTNKTDSEGNLLPDELRLTRLGRFLRATSLDELPELINVLRGEMSLVGPRPLLATYLSRYSPEQMRRHDVKPGITGWVQINGRNALSWEEKFELDVWYVDHRSLGLDLAILYRTFWQVLTRKGISQPGHATAEEFRGNRQEA